MRVWALASCGGIFMLTTYIAFRHDANAQKADNDLLLGRSETDPSETDTKEELFPKGTYLHTVSQPQVQQQLASFSNPLASAPSTMASQVRDAKSIPPVSPQEHSAQSSDKRNSPTHSTASGSSSEESRPVQTELPQVVKNNLSVPTASQNLVAIPTSGTSAATVPVATIAPVNSDFRNVSNRELQGPEPIDNVIVTTSARHVSTELSSDAVQSLTAATIATPEAVFLRRLNSLQAGPQFLISWLLVLLI